MTQHGPEAVNIPRDVEDFYQAAALALLQHTAPLAAVKGADIQAAYKAAMSAVQKTFRADTRGIQQAEAGQEIPRLPSSPTMRTSTPRRKASQVYHDAIAAIRRALPSEQARAVFDTWQEPEHIKRIYNQALFEMIYVIVGDGTCEVTPQFTGPYALIFGQEGQKQ